MSEPAAGTHDPHQDANPRASQAPDTRDYVSLASTGPNIPAGPLATPVAAAQRQRGRFIILRLHAKGGLGQVSLARDEKLRRQVALKEIRPDRLDADARRRFLNEAEITGQLEHPGIVPIYALDEADGQPYYAMRFIQGQNLAEAIAAHYRQPTLVGLRGLLKRFGDVCQALGYAHSKDVIHRDMKPGNIMLGAFGETLVLDWGLAKRLGGTPPPPPAGMTPAESAASTPASLPETVEAPLSILGSEHLTQAGQVLGTPAYMSPEQAAGHSEHIGLATDIYALGAILYEVLTGRPPFQGPAPEVLGRLRQGPPPTPTRARRGVPPALEAICLKAMARAPAERYASAVELAREVDHWLADEPVQAYREPWPARLLRWGRRHRTMVASAGVLLLTSVVGLALGLFFLTEKQRQILAAHGAAVQAEGKATRSAVRAEAINSFLLNDLLAQADPGQNARDRHVTVEELLDKAADRLDRDQQHALTREPEVEATLRAVIGETYLALDATAKAERQLARAKEIAERALGGEHVVTLTAQGALASLFQRQGKLAEAETLLRHVWGTRSRVLGAEDKETLHAQAELALVVNERGRLDEAKTLMQQSADDLRRVLGPEHPNTLWAMNAFTRVLHSRGQLAEATEMARQMWAAQGRVLGPHHPDTVATLTVLAALLREQGKLEEAEPLQRQAVQISRQVLGPEHANTIVTEHNLALLLLDQGNLADAEPLMREVLAKRRRSLGNDHPATLSSTNNLAALLRSQGKLAEAEAMFQDLLQGCRRALGPEHPHTLIALNSLAVAMRAQNKLDQAEPLLRELLLLRRKVLPAGHAEIAAALVSLGGCLLDRGQAALARPLCEESLAIYRKAYPASHPLTAVALTALGEALLGTGRPKDAEPLLREAMAIREKALPPRDWRTGETESLLGGSLAAQSSYAEAEPLLVAGYETMRAAKAAPPLRITKALDRIIALYDGWGMTEKADQWRSK
jgi:tetratricopeptide (TPR) repeat protein